MSEVSGSFISIDPSSITTPKKSSVTQFVDILQSDVASIDTNTRRKYEVFVTGDTTNTLTSSIFQTIYDQDFTLSTSNPLLDVTIGVQSEDQTVNDVVVPVVNGKTYAYDSAGKIIVDNNDYMIREKVSIYRQYAQSLLGDANSFFVAPHGELATTENRIDAAVFINIRRLFVRDNIVKGSFKLKLSKNAAFLSSDQVSENTYGTLNSNLALSFNSVESDGNTFENVEDTLSSVNMSVSPVAGEVSTLVNSSGAYVGVVYYDKGIIVLDAKKVFSSTQYLRGVIDSPESNASITQFGPWSYYDSSASVYYNNLYTTQESAESASTSSIATAYEYVIGSTTLYQAGLDDAPALVSSDSILEFSPIYVDGGANDYYDLSNESGKKIFFGTILDLFNEASIDNVLDHIFETYMGQEELTALTFRNETIINSKFIFCRASPSQLNYSTNPTYTDSDGEIVAKNSTGDTFTFVTTIGLYDSNSNLVAVAKTSRPIEKNKETDLSVRIRLDF